MDYNIKINPNACFDKISYSRAEQSVSREYRLRNPYSDEDMCTINEVIASIEYIGELLLRGNKIDEYVRLIDNWTEFVINDSFFDPIRESDKICAGYNPEWAFHSYCGTEMHLKNKVTTMYDILEKKFSGRSSIRKVVEDYIKLDSYDHKGWTCNTVIQVGKLTEYIDIVAGRTPQNKTAIMTIPGTAVASSIVKARSYADKAGLKTAVVCAEKFSGSAIKAAKEHSVSLYNVYTCNSYSDYKNKVLCMYPFGVILEKVKGTKSCSIIDSATKSLDGDVFDINYTEDRYTEFKKLARDILQKHTDNLKKYSDIVMDRIYEIGKIVTGLSCYTEIIKSVSELYKYRDGNLTADEAEKKIAFYSKCSGQAFL